MIKIKGKKVASDLTEATYTTSQERRVKNEIIENLRDDGEGHHHAAYAARLELFEFHIIPYSSNPNYTAAISFEEGIIYVSEGFLIAEGLNKKEILKQLNMILRHELAHNLLMHSVRMIKTLTDKHPIPGKNMQFSKSLHELLNIIMDDEISNKVYSSSDKDLARNLKIGANVIRGLVTEDHKADWINMSVEEMFFAMEKELNQMHKELKDLLKAISAEDNIYTTIEDFIENNPNYKDNPMVHSYIRNYLSTYGSRNNEDPIKYPEKFIKYLVDKLNYKVINDKFEENAVLLLKVCETYRFVEGETEEERNKKEQKLDSYIEEIKDSSMLDRISIEGATFITPEEKMAALGIINSVKYIPPKPLPEDYIAEWNYVMDHLSDLSAEELESLAAKLKEHGMKVAGVKVEEKGESDD